MREEVAKATLPASAYFSSARALGSIQHHREFPDQTHPLDTRPSHHRHSHHLYPLLCIYIYICTCIYIHLVPFLRLHPPTLSLSPAITLFLSRFVSPLPSGSFPLCFTVVSSSNSLSLSLSFIRYSYYSLPSGSL